MHILNTYGRKLFLYFPNLKQIETVMEGKGKEKFKSK